MPIYAVLPDYLRRPPGPICIAAVHLFSFLFSIVFCGVVAPAYAWDDFGHMAVAYLAYQNLSPATRDRVKVLLQLNPYHDKWAAAVPAGSSDADKDMIVFMFASTWPDEIKGNPDYVQDGDNRGNSPHNSPDPTRNTGFDDMLMHKYRHFIDKPFSTPDGLPLPDPLSPNVQDSIAIFRGVIASTDPDPKKAYDLSWLLHLVGDIHQPLHAATRVTSTLTNGDDGGNKVFLSCTSCPSELHLFWDDVLGTTTKLTTPPELKGLPDAASIAAIISTAKSINKPKAALAAKSSEVDWAQESFDAAKAIVYPGLHSTGNGKFKISSSYMKKAKKIARKRVALGGARLANMLNNELK